MPNWPDLPQAVQQMIMRNLVTPEDGQVVNLTRDADNRPDLNIIHTSREAARDGFAEMRLRNTYVFEDADQMRRLRRPPPRRIPGRRRGQQFVRHGIRKIRIRMNYTHRAGQPPNWLLLLANAHPRTEDRQCCNKKRDNVDPWHALLPVAPPEEWVGARLPVEENIPVPQLTIDNRLFQVEFLRRRWDWVFKNWREYGLLEVREVELQLDDLMKWHTLWGPIGMRDNWMYPARDLFLLLFQVPNWVTTVTIVSRYAGFLQRRLRSIERNSSHGVPYGRQDTDEQIDFWMTNWYENYKHKFYRRGTTWHERLRSLPFQLRWRFDNDVE
ncbi:hypothetical protein W97_03177 [Coniosporium apollinis CBS 100218]|uniref:Uncharacterized protein n=1 Tax=Coniosporium apollinis (strain CBS 100218) TaxID=1168221 RepID=R7YQ24_CONA1|nr:uncharacterized protein W97_03177 [Coniosporium apollinis CBS 100218]EON63948.1 hypothetical protein W97_03177 [Coniosporium apollinis CBS 100218]